MKKLLIIPALLALTIFSIYHYKIEEKKVYEQPTVIEKMEQKIINEHYEIYTAKKEINASREKIFTVETTAEVNTTRDNEITLTAKVKNSNNAEACNFLWYEEEKFIGMGSTLERSFPKGEHILTVIAKDSEGHESNATVTLTAWDYKKIETLHFSADYGVLEYREVDIYDHKGRFIVMDDGSFAKRSYVYDEDNNQIERSVIYYDYPRESNKYLYTFDENHNKLTTEVINIYTNKTLYYNIKTYNEDGNVTSSKSGKNEDELHDDYINYDNNYYGDVYYEYNSTHIAHKDDKTILDDNDNIIYQERNYDYMKTIEEYSYDDNNSMTQYIYTTISEENREEININNYDENRNITSTEQIYKVNEEVTCHYKTISTYNEDGTKSTEKKETLDGICSEYGVYDSFKKFSYDKDGRVNNVVSSLEKESDGHTTLKIIKSYTNDLE